MTQMLFVDSQQDVIDGSAGRAYANGKWNQFPKWTLVHHFLVIKSPICAKLFCFAGKQRKAGKHRKSF